MRKELKNNRGITLIALVITMIVLLILAGVSIATLTGDNGLLTRAESSKEANRAGTVDDEVKLWITDTTLYNATKVGTAPKNEEQMLEDLKSRNLVKDIKPGEEIDRVAKTITIDKRVISYKIEGSTSEVVTEINPGETATGGNKTYVDEEKRIAKIPEGFTVSDKDGEKKIDEGLVVIAPDGSEFVWVPVENPISDTEENATTNKAMAVNLGTEENPQYRGLLYDFSETSSMVISGTTTTTGEYREPDSLTDTTDADGNVIYLNAMNAILGTSFANANDFKIYMQNEYNEIIKSVVKYKGFYIGRYESSLNGTKIQSKKGITPTTANNSITNMWYGLYAKQMKYAEENRITSVKSSMIYGSQYDAMLNWAIKGNDKEKVTATGNGNHSESVKNTGVELRDKINNIYDLEGNLHEWTAEARYTHNRVYRGGSYYLSDSPSSRSYYYPVLTFTIYGSRPVLYL